jgi:hypothetical protein
MMNATFRRVIAAAVASAAALIVGTSAQAAKVATIWDPPFGGTLNGDLAWSGEATFQVPDTCLSGANPGSTSVFVPDTFEGGCDMFLNSASVRLYKLSNPSIFQVATFGFSALDGPTIDGMEVANINGLNAVVGIQTRPYEFLAFLPNNLLAPNGTLWMWWTMPNGIDPVNGSTARKCTVNYYTGPCDAAGNPLYGADDPRYSSNPAPIALLTTCYDDGTCSVISVPEPGTLGLALGALGAGWLARRRKKKTA